MTKQELIDVLIICKWSITAFGMWCLFFVFGLMWLSHDSYIEYVFDKKVYEIDNRIDELDKKLTKETIDIKSKMVTHK